MAIPSVKNLLNPTFQAIKKLGGSASITELDEEVIKTLNLTPEELAEPHNHRLSEIEYRLSWSRTYLKMHGVLENSARGIWVVTAKGNDTQTVPDRLVRINKPKTKTLALEEKSDVDISTNGLSTELAETVLEQTWQEKLSKILISLSPEGFERLCQRLLRESGFTQVSVTGRSGDGGIDGFGVVKIGGLLSFPILFQCKRYQGLVSPSVIRDFRGAMVGRADRGLVITTGTFTREARKEATRDGAPPIDLVDGQQLITKLKELGLGIEIKLVEEVIVQEDWFKNI